MKKILAVLLAGMMAVTAFSGCGGGSTESSGSESGGGEGGNTSVEVKDDLVDESVFGDEDNITLKVWAPDKAVALVKQQVEDFKAAYPGKTFTKIEVVAQGEGDAGTQILNDASVAADVFSFASDQLNKLVDAKVIADVAFADYVTEKNAEETVTAGTIKNTLYAYPETNDNGYYLVYDNTALTADDAKTLEGTLEACKKAGKQFIMDCGDGFYACTFAFTAGVKINGLNAEGTQQFAEYNEKDAVDTLMAFAKLMKDYKGTFSSQQPANISTGFKNGKVAAGVDGSWNSKADKDALGDKLAAAKLPTINVNGTDKDLVSLFGYKYIGVNSHTKFQRSAQILAYYLTGLDCQKERATELGWGPTNTAAQEAASSDPLLQAASAQSANAVPQVNIAPTFWTAMGTLGSTMYKDDWDPSNEAKTKDLLNKVIAQIKDE